jgi:signal transduction histidine kinase
MDMEESSTGAWRVKAEVLAQPTAERARGLQHAKEIALVGVLYFFVGYLGLLFGLPQAPLVFPPAGIALAAPLVFGFRVWPGVFLGAWFLGFTAVNDPLSVAAVATGNTLEGLAAAWLINRYAGGARFYERPVDIVKFALLAGALTPLMCPPFGIANISIRSLAFWVHGPSTLAVWWLGELTSVMVLTPLLVLMGANRRAGWDVARTAEFAVLLLLLTAVSAAVFTNLPPAWAQSYLLPYLCLPFPLWAALRFGSGATTIATCAQALVALWGTLHGYGLFAWTVPDHALMAYQGFTAFNSFMGLTVAAIVQQREEAQRALQRAHDGLDLEVRRRTQDLRTEIEVRKQAEAGLAEARDQLEQRVQDRTAELTRVNQCLEIENGQRRHAEEALSRVLQRLIDVQETERCRISRELHDEMGQNLNALKLGLNLVRNDSLRLGLPPPSLPQLEELTDRLLQNVHRMAWELRPPALDDLGLAPALQRYSEEWSARSGIALDFHNLALQSQRLPASIETALYRVTQEALTNVVKHSKASRVSVLLNRQSDFVSLIIEDDGQGFADGEILERPTPNGKMGLVGMKERVASAGGTLQIESALNSGTSLYVRIPMNDRSRSTEST